MMRIDNKAFQNAPKFTILKAKVQKFSGEGAQLPPQTPSPRGLDPLTVKRWRYF